MKFSIITVAFNASKSVGDALKSVAGQTYPDIEHIVIDGGSSDNTQSIVEKELRSGGIFCSDPDDGIYDAMNKGIGIATGDVIGLLNADDMLAQTDTISKVADKFLTRKSDAIFGNVAFIRGDQTDKILRRYDSSRFSPAKLAWGWMPAHPGMYMTRNAYDRVGKYRTDYKIAADYEFIIRAFLRNQLTYQYLPEILVKMRLGGVSTDGLSAKLAINREVLRACRENDVYSNPFMIASKYPMKLLEYFR